MNEYITQQGVLSDLDIQNDSHEADELEGKRRDQKMIAAYIETLDVLCGRTAEFHDFLLNESQKAKRYPAYGAKGMRMTTTIRATKHILNMEHDLYTLLGNTSTSCMAALSKMGDEDECPVWVNTQGSTVLVYMPRLPIRSNAKGHLAEDVLISALSNSGLSSGKIRHIEFYHVYDSATIALAKDADNYNYKGVIDAISLALVAPDSAKYCSYCADTVCDDSVPQGTYIRILERKEFSVLPTEFSIFEKKF